MIAGVVSEITKGQQPRFLTATTVIMLSINRLLAGEHYQLVYILSLQVKNFPRVENIVWVKSLLYALHNI